MTRRTASRPARHAFTLVELLVAVASSAILISAMGSLIVLTANAIPAADDRGGLAANASFTLHRIADDLSFATEVTPAVGSVTMTVPDRNGDATGEPVVYWLASGGKLKRGLSPSDSAAVTLMTGVTAFTAERDAGTGVIRAVRLVLTVNGLGSVETSVETLGRPAG